MRIPILSVIYESNMQWKKQINNLIGDPMLLLVVSFFFGGFLFCVCGFLFFFTKASISLVFCVCWFFSSSVEEQLVIKTKNV